jgi:hypothetical protein
MSRGLLVVAAALVAGCASAPRVQPAATSKSQFDSATYAGETVTLGSPTPGEEAYRVFEQGATAFVTLQSVRTGAEASAAAHCERKGKAVHGLVETAARPPFILGNFARVELVFECVARAPARGMPASSATVK